MVINQLSSIGRDPNIINIIKQLIIAATCIGVLLYFCVIKKLKNKKVIKKANMNGINCFFPAAIGHKQINNITRATIDTVFIYIFNTLYSKLNVRPLPYQLVYYSSLTKKSVAYTPLNLVLCRPNSSAPTPTLLPN